MGTPEKVEQDALSCTQKGAAGGDYVLSADCLLAPETPPTNIHALLETGLPYGRYDMKYRQIS